MEDLLPLLVAISAVLGVKYAAKYMKRKNIEIDSHDSSDGPILGKVRKNNSIDSGGFDSGGDFGGGGD